MEEKMRQGGGWKRVNQQNQSNEQMENEEDEIMNSKLQRAN